MRASKRPRLSAQGWREIDSTAPPVRASLLQRAVGGELGAASARPHGCRGAVCGPGQGAVAYLSLSLS